MTTKAEAREAFKAMKDIGIPESKTKPVLKKLLKLFDKNWEAIKHENYRLLADAIFDYEEAEAAEKEKKKPDNAERGGASEAATWQDGPMLDENVQDEPERPLKRLRLKHQVQGAPSNGQSSPSSSVGALKIPKPEPGENMVDELPQPLVRNKGKQPMSSHNTGALKLKEPNAERGAASSGKQKQPQTVALIKPKDEPFTDEAVSIEPLAVIHPERPDTDASSKPTDQVACQNGHRSETVDGLDNDMGSTAQEKQLQDFDVPDRGRKPGKLNIAVSALGNVQISLTCNPISNGLEMQVPDLEAVLKKVNDNCLKTYKIMDPDFSVANLMKQLCDSVEELGKNADGAPESLSGQDACEM